MSDGVVIRANGRDLSGWTTVRMVEHMDSLVPEIAVEMTNAAVDSLGRTAATGATVGDVRTLVDAVDELEEDDLIEVLLDGELVMTGYVDSDEFNYGATNASLRVTASARTVDLVDASAIGHRKGWRDASVEQIVSDICAPFGIKCTVNAFDVDPIARFVIEPGESAADAIGRAISARKLLAITRADGNIVLERSASLHSGANVELGQNVWVGGMSRTRRERFSEYIFRGQSAGTEDAHGKDASQLGSSVKDAVVTRYRPLLIIGARQRTRADLAARAEWERNVRFGRSQVSRYTVPGWTAPNGATWAVNSLVGVADPWCGVADDMVVSTLERSLDARGRLTMLTLMRPEAFDVEPPVHRKKRRRRGF